MMLAVARVLPDVEPDTDLDNWELVIAAILAEAAVLRDADRPELAARVLALGGYESPEGTDQSNASARLASRLAARLAGSSV